MIIGKKIRQRKIVKPTYPKLNGSMEKVLGQMTVRPYVLLQLLYYLIELSHVVFRGKGSAQKLEQQMREAVARGYHGRGPARSCGRAAGIAIAGRAPT